MHERVLHCFHLPALPLILESSLAKDRFLPEPETERVVRLRSTPRCERVTYDNIEIVGDDRVGRIDVVRRDVNDWSPLGGSVDIVVRSEVILGIFDVDDCQVE